MKGRLAVIDAWVKAGKLPPVEGEYALHNLASTQHYADFSAQQPVYVKKKMTKIRF